MRPRYHSVRPATATVLLASGAFPWMLEPGERRAELKRLQARYERPGSVLANLVGPAYAAQERGEVDDAEHVIIGGWPLTCRFLLRSNRPFR
jgi:hypothetical protein